MGYQGNTGNLPETEDETKSSGNRSSDAEDLRGDNTEQNKKVADDTSADDAGTRNTETDTIGNP